MLRSFTASVKRIVSKGVAANYLQFFRPYSSISSNGKNQKYPSFDIGKYSDETVYIEGETKEFPQLFSHRLTPSQLNEIPTHPIPNLPVLNSMVQLVKTKIPPKILEHTAIVGAQHILETTSSLGKAFIDTGIPPKNIWMIGKIYSTSLPVVKAFRQLGIQLMDDAFPQTPDGYGIANRKAIKNMWDQLSHFAKEQGINRITTVDDGGRVIELTPENFWLNYMMAAVEQTRGGLYSKAVNVIVCPLIPIASSAIKKHFLEPFMIAKALFRAESSIHSLGIDNNKTYGVIGNGAIGRALIDYLLKKSLKVVVYDSNPKAFQDLSSKNLVRADSMEKAIANTDCIFGCTGQDITKDIDVFSVADFDKTLVSTSSEQNEYFSLLQILARIFYRDHGKTYFNPLGDIVCSNGHRKITIKNMGYPLNFPVPEIGNPWIQPWNVPAQDIELIQCAMYAGTIQAILSANKPIDDGVTINRPQMHCLDPYAQRYIAMTWGQREYHRFASQYPKNQFKLFDSTDWIVQNSGGEYHPTLLSECFKKAPVVIFDHQEISTQPSTPQPGL